MPRLARILIGLGMLAASTVPTSAHATPITHKPPWQQELCTPLQASAAHIDILRAGGCTLPNPLGYAGIVSAIGQGAPCPPASGGCVNVTPHWGPPTDSYLIPSAGSYTVHVESTPGICIAIGLYRGDSRYGAGCGTDYAFTVTDRPRIVVTMTGTGAVSSITYAPA